MCRDGTLFVHQRALGHQRAFSFRQQRPKTPIFLTLKRRPSAEGKVQSTLETIDEEHSLPEEKLQLHASVDNNSMHAGAESPTRSTRNISRQSSKMSHGTQEETKRSKSGLKQAGSSRSSRTQSGRSSKSSRPHSWFRALKSWTVLHPEEKLSVLGFTSETTENRYKDAFERGMFNRLKRVMIIVLPALVVVDLVKVLQMRSTGDILGQVKGAIWLRLLSLTIFTTIFAWNWELETRRRIMRCILLFRNTVTYVVHLLECTQTDSRSDSVQFVLIVHSVCGALVESNWHHYQLRVLSLLILPAAYQYFWSEQIREDFWAEHSSRFFVMLVCSFLVHLVDTNRRKLWLENGKDAFAMALC